MPTHVNYDNIYALLTGIAANLKTKINAIDLTQAQKDQIALIDKIIKTGNGTNFLSNDGTYKNIPLDQLQTMSDKLTTIYNTLGITTSDGIHYTANISTPQAILDKLALIITNGTGTKLLTDNGTYQEYVPTGYRQLNTDELNAVITAINTSL